MVALLASLFLSIPASLFFYQISYTQKINPVSHHRKPTIIHRNGFAATGKRRSQISPVKNRFSRLRDLPRSCISKGRKKISAFVYLLSLCASQSALPFSSFFLSLSLSLSLCLFLCSHLIIFSLFHSQRNPLQSLMDGHDLGPDSTCTNLNRSLGDTSSGSKWLKPTWQNHDRPIHCSWEALNLFLPLTATCQRYFLPYKLPCLLHYRFGVTPNNIIISSIKIMCE